jgi:hypothetical protein
VSDKDDEPRLLTNEPLYAATREVCSLSASLRPLPRQQTLWDLVDDILSIIPDDDDRMDHVASGW